MSLKSELLIFQAALEAYDERQLSTALTQFAKIAETSKVQWNMGAILASMGRHDEAIARFGESTLMDQYLVVGWYQRGVSYFMIGLYDKAVKDFDIAFTHMRSNKTITYTQLGLAHILYSAEILFNLGLTRLYLRQTSAGMQDLRKAQQEKAIPEHRVIDDCIRDQGRGYTVFAVPDGLLFRPSESKLKNLKARDYMGKAVLVAASDPNDAYTTFTGITRLQRGQTPKGVALDPSHPLSRSATISTPIIRTSVATEGDLPIATKMAKRSQTFRNSPNPNSPSPPTGLTRSLTISNPDSSPPISPARHARSRTVDEASIYSSTTHLVAPPLVRPDRPRIVIPASEIPMMSMQSARYPTFPQEKNRLQPPAPAYTPPARPSPTPPRAQPFRGQGQGSLQGRAEYLQTPGDDYRTPLDEIYDDYRSPTPELEPDLPYTAIGRAFNTSPMSAKSHSPSPFPSKPHSSYRPPVVTRFNSTRSNISNLSRSGSMGRQAQTQGLMLTVEDADSPVSPLEMAKIRIKVHHGGHTRGMSVLPTDTYANLIRALRAKFPNLGRSVGIRFRDEDGDMLSMQDESDFDAAVDVARVLSNGRAEGRLEIWID